jgi:lipopolysaccharide/colanic/teichoic acid biosynthesis glycosyltransferase
MGLAKTAGLAIKRIVDVVAAIVLLAPCLPLFLIVGVWIKLDSPGPIFFRQERLGYRGKLFSVFKFRSMTVEAELLTLGLPGNSASPHITRVGHYLRNYRIDELPQLINVVRGEMSLVGPRPLVPLYFPTWTAEERRRLDMPPGMTGWQQVSGAAKHTWEQRVVLDVWYVDHWSLWLDLWILLRTPWVVIAAKTVYGRGGMDVSSIPRRAVAEEEAQHDA